MPSFSCAALDKFVQLGRETVVQQEAAAEQDVLSWHGQHIVAAIPAGILASRLQDVPQGTQQGLWSWMLDVSWCHSSAEVLLGVAQAGVVRSSSQSWTSDRGWQEDAKRPAPNVWWV